MRRRATWPEGSRLGFRSVRSASPLPRRFCRFARSLTSERNPAICLQSVNEFDDQPDDDKPKGERKCSNKRQGDLWWYIPRIVVI
jgi:hypothetical protein